MAALVLPGFFLASLAPLTDAFYLAAERGERMIGSELGEIPDFRLTLVSADGGPVPIGRHGIMHMDQPISTTDRFDFIWIPGIRISGEAALRERLATSGPTLEWLRNSAAKGAVIGASGAAVTLTMAARLASGLAVPVADPLLPIVRAVFPRFRHAAHLGVADHGNLLLSSGIGHDVQAITSVFARLLSPESGRWIRSVFGVEALATDAWQAEDARDPLVARARLMLEQRFSAAVSISSLAAELCVSHAVLIRRFRRELGTTPSSYVQHLRLDAAQRLLLRFDLSVDMVAAAVGYGDARLFREMFRKTTGQSATGWRRAERARLRNRSEAASGPSPRSA